MRTYVDANGNLLPRPKLPDESASLSQKIAYLRSYNDWKAKISAVAEDQTPTFVFADRFRQQTLEGVDL